MLRRALIKSVVGTAIVAGGLMVPGVVAGSAQFALTATKTGCTYETVSTTSVSLSTSASAVQAGTSVTGSATASTTAGSIPNGTVTVTAYPFQGNTYSSTGEQLAQGAVTAAQPSVSYAWNTSTKGNRTYKLLATYTTTNCDYADSTSAPKYVSVYKFDTRTTVPQVSTSSTQWSATVDSQFGDEANEAGAIPTGDARFFYLNNGNQSKFVDKTLTAGAGSVSIPSDAKTNASLVRVDYVPDAAGSSRFNPSSGTPGN